MDQTDVFLVVPSWQTRSWYNGFQGMLFQEAYVVTSQKENLILAQKPEELQPLCLKLTYLIGKMSGKYT